MVYAVAAKPILVGEIQPHFESSKKRDANGRGRAQNRFADREI